MVSTHERAAHDLKNNYSNVAQIIRNRNHVIITNNGINEAVLIPYDEFEKYEEFLYIRYVNEKLTEAEAIADDPREWTDIDELLNEWDNWGAVKN